MGKGERRGSRINGVTDIYTSISNIKGKFIPIECGLKLKNAKAYGH